MATNMELICEGPQMSSETTLPDDDDAPSGVEIFASFVSNKRERV